MLAVLCITVFYYTFPSIGCKIEELGIKVPNTRRIPDRHMSSSSELSSRYPAFRGRIGVETRGSWGDAWCASDSDADPYIQVFFGRYRMYCIRKSNEIKSKVHDIGNKAQSSPCVGH